MPSHGVPELDIARVVEVDQLIQRRCGSTYREELDLGAIKPAGKIAEILFLKATTQGPQCVTVAIFRVKTRGGWRETPQAHEVAIRGDARDLSDEELMTIAGSLAPVKLLPRPGN